MPSCNEKEACRWEIFDDLGLNFQYENYITSGADTFDAHLRNCNNKSPILLSYFGSGGLGKGAGNGGRSGWLAEAGGQDVSRLAAGGREKPPA